MHGRCAYGASRENKKKKEISFMVDETASQTAILTRARQMLDSGSQRNRRGGNVWANIAFIHIRKIE